MKLNIHKEIKSIISKESKTIPDFIDTKSAEHQVIYDIVSNSVYQHILNVCISSFLKKEYIEDVSFDISEILFSIGDFTTKRINKRNTISFLYTQHISKFIKFLEVYATSIEEYEASRNLNTLYDVLSGSKNKNQ